MSDNSPQNQIQPQAKAEVPVQVFQALDQRDEDQILAEMRGEILEDLVYDVTMSGRRVTNLSYAGVKEAIRNRGNTETLDVHTEDVEGEIRALVRVRDLQNRIDVLGASSAEKNKPFAYTLAVNKAERNAFAKLIPAKWLASLVNEYLARAKGEQPKQGEPEKATKAAEETGTAEKASVPQPQVKPSVPVTKDSLVQEGLRQFPLTEGSKAVGMLNATETEVSIVPEKPLKSDSSPISSFLIPRVLDSMKTKNGFSYTIVENGQAELAYILVTGKLSDQQIKELQTAARWAFSKAMECQ